MGKITIEVSDDQMDLWVSTELRRCYEDAQTYWRTQEDHRELCRALIKVIKHYTSDTEFHEWYSKQEGRKYD